MGEDATTVDEGEEIGADNSMIKAGVGMCAMCARLCYIVCCCQHSTAHPQR